MRTVGIGSSGSIQDGQGFVAETGLGSPAMLWDPSLSSWNHYEVYGQPTAVLVNASGDTVHTFLGAFDADEVLARIAQM